MTPAGFPHSDISGSCACTRLAGAYRSVPRPSSALDAKASPVCPYLRNLGCYGEEATLAPCVLLALRVRLRVLRMWLVSCAARPKANRLVGETSPCHDPQGNLDDPGRLMSPIDKRARYIYRAAK